MNREEQVKEINRLILTIGFIPRTVLSWEDARSIRDYLEECRNILEDSLIKNPQMD